MSIITGGTSLRLENDFDSDGIAKKEIIALDSSSTSISQPNEYDIKKIALGNKSSNDKKAEQALRLQVLRMQKKELSIKIVNADLLNQILRHQLQKTPDLDNISDEDTATDSNFLANTSSSTSSTPSDGTVSPNTPTLPHGMVSHQIPSHQIPSHQGDGFDTSFSSALAGTFDDVYRLTNM